MDEAARRAQTACVHPADRMLFPPKRKDRSSAKTNKKSKAAYRIIYLYLKNTLPGVVKRTTHLHAPFSDLFWPGRLRWPLKSYTCSERYSLNIPKRCSHSWVFRQWSEKE